MASFRELEEKDKVTADEIVTTLEDYARTGAAIIGSVVIELLRRCRPKPTVLQIARLVQACDLGVLAQLSHPKEVMQYAIVKQRILEKIGL